VGIVELGSEDRDFVHREASSTPKTELTGNAPIIHKIGAPSIAQIEKLIAELQEARKLLESEEERIQREMVRYVKFVQMSLACLKIASDTVSGWHQAGHPMRRFLSGADDSTGAR
jgi:prophage DNA circulation protein